MIESTYLKIRHNYGESYISNALPVLHRCPSIQSFFRPSPVAQVYIYLFPGRKMISKHVRLDSTVFQLKEAISRFCRVPPEHLDLRLKQKLLTDAKTLQELGAKAHRKLRLTVEVNRRLNPEAKLRIPDTNQLPSKVVITEKPDTVRMVTLKRLGNPPLMKFCIPLVETIYSFFLGNNGKEIRFLQKVRIVHSKRVKPVLGGYLDKRVNRVYHDAATSPEDEDVEDNVFALLGIEKDEEALEKDKKELLVPEESPRIINRFVPLEILLLLNKV